MFKNYTMTVMAAQNKKLKKPNIEINNRKAKFDYEFLETYVCGIVLFGTEIKSIRDGKASLVDTYCYVNNGELWMKNSYIAKYENGSWTNHEERRERKLLANKKEIEKMRKAAEQPSVTIVPIKMFINERGFCKVLVAVARGKRQFDKRESIKLSDTKRELDRAMKSFS